MYSQSVANIRPFDAAISHRIDMTTLAMLFVGFFSCLIRSDYNFVIIFFCYFVWQQRKDGLSLRIIMASLIILFVFDFIFALTEIRLWVSDDTDNPIWQTIRPMHNFGIFCFVLTNLLKMVLTVLVCKGILENNKAVQTR